MRRGERALANSPTPAGLYRERDTQPPLYPPDRGKSNAPATANSPISGRIRPGRPIRGQPGYQAAPAMRYNQGKSSERTKRGGYGIGDTDWRSMFKPYPSTVRIWGFCFNLMLRAVIVALTWSGLFLTGLAFNWLMNYLRGWAGAHDSAIWVIDVSSAIVLGLILCLMGVTALTGLSGIFALTSTALRDPSPKRPRRK